MLASRDSAWKRQLAAAALLLLAVLSSLLVFRAMDGLPLDRPGASEGHWLPLALAGGFLVGFLSLAFMAARRGSQQRDQRRRHGLIDSLPGAMLVVDGGGAVVSCNRAAAAVLQIDQRRLLGMNIVDPRLGVAQSAEPEHPALRCLRTGAPQNLALRLGAAGAGARWLEMRASPLADVDGNGAPGMLVSLDDVTRAHEEMQDLRNGESRLRNLLQGISGDALVLLDTAGRITSWNAGAERMTGYRADEIVGDSLARLYPSDEVARGKPEEDLHAAAETGRCQCEGWRLRKDGSRFWADAVIEATGTHAGRPEGFVMVARDRTAQHEEQARLQATQHLHQAIFDSTPMAFIATDLRGMLRQINGAAERLLWLRNDEVAGSVNFMRLCDLAEPPVRSSEPGGAERLRPDAPFEALVARARDGYGDEHECALVRKDGSRVPVQLAVNPLRDAQGRPEGYLLVATDISQRKRREDYARHIAYHDPVTGLPNRSLLTDRLKLAIEHAKRDETRVGLLLLDIDHFKRINDLLGTPVGDQVLATVAQRLASSLRASDTVARIGGDEFVVLLPEVTDAANAERLAATMLERLAAPARIGREELHLSASIGVAVYPDHGRDALVLLQHAETALQQAKAAGRRCYRLFNTAMERAGAEKLVLENALRRALRLEEFALHYQPQVSLDTGEVVGVEALVRWRNPVGGLVSPARFIPAAEDNGLIIPIGEWVLRTACAQTCRLQDRTGRPLQLAVNLSPRQFRQAGLVDFIARTLQETGFPAALLEIEITEGVLMEPSEENLERLRQLRALGVSVAVDDFGTGYSSLSYITRFPIDTLKIDRSFISRVTDKQSDAAVTQAIIALSQSLRTRVVAEGVETPQQLMFLREHHRDIGLRGAAGRPSSADAFSVQGYHFSRAVPFDALVERFDELQEACGTRLRETGN